MATISTNPKPFVFILMPFAAEFNDVYQIGIKEACKKAGTYCERLDDQIFSENMIDRIYNQIGKADLIIADMTGRNANVFYEVGYAHALGKTVVLLTKDSSDIPFDLKHHVHLVYGSSLSNLRDELQKRIRHFVAHASTKDLSGKPEIQLFLNDVELFKNKEFVISIAEREVSDIDHSGFPRGRVKERFLPIRLTAYHPQQDSFETACYGLQLITPGLFSKCMIVSPGHTTIYNSVRMPGNLIAHRPLDRLQVSPGEWEAMDFPLSSEKDDQGKFGIYKFELHLLRNGPPFVFPFTVNIAELSKA